jgi:hypothetical protein
MSDLVAAVETAAEDPLVVALGLLVLGVVMARLLFKARSGRWEMRCGSVRGAADRRRSELERRGRRSDSWHTRARRPSPHGP